MKIEALETSNHRKAEALIAQLVKIGPSAVPSEDRWTEVCQGSRTDGIGKVELKTSKRFAGETVRSEVIR